ncbi:MAG TPA: hypothetical protein VFA28_10580 [Bryobacteraceae bacterium]|jgi:hypothetical protein|nr:hypothetical protein [Bryobacteraceae bacterium]
MRRILRLLLTTAAVIPLLRAGEPGAHAEYVGGTRPEIPNNCPGVLQAIDEQYFVFYARKTNLRIPYERINMLEYGQKVDRRYVAAVLISPVFLLSKKRQHFLTVGYTDERGQEQALIFRVDKEHIRAMLVSLEAKTGRRVQYQDEEARKAGKG